jgi:hypothetical protein
MSWLTGAYQYALKLLEPTARVQSLQRTLDSVRTGDLVYFCTHDWTGCGIALCTGHLLSHIGMVVRTDNNVPHLLESVYHSDALPDALCDKRVCHAGVRLVPLREKLLFDRDVSFYVYVQYLQVDDYTRQRMTHSLASWLVGVAHRRYEARVLNLLWAQYHCCCFMGLCQHHVINEDTRTLFCSELVADAYRAMGLLDASTNVSLIVPRQFISAALALSNYAHLSKTGYYVSFDDAEQSRIDCSMDSMERGGSVKAPTVQAKTMSAPSPSSSSLVPPLTLGNVVVSLSSSSLSPSRSDSPVSITMHFQ